ncbi:hypothetical protein HPP92_028325 [Vanilla planifolia]|uniref:Uncharacterized protein n=1 Tax=Vanilla planifolia TaxID=51239 RepID=A0A835P5Q1_VANPL|nr:hypothetical protein HPP92_028325 [Vanilla planifolia]
MAVELIGTTIIKPTPSTSTEPKHVPLTIFDRAAFNLHVPVLYAFLPPNPSNDSLKLGLSRILSYFPHLAGRITTDNHLGSLCIHLNDAGVRVIETTVSSTLADMLPLDATSNLSYLHPSIGDGVEFLLQIQFNRYSCGGLVIGATSHHRVADGQSMSNFFTSWANMVRRGTGPHPPPFLDRAAIVVPRNIPRVEFNHREVEFRPPVDSFHEATDATATFKVENLKVFFPSDFIARLKALVPERRCSTFEVLLSHLWRVISKARGLPESQVTKVRVAVNGRARMRPVVPAEFFGNLVLWAHPTATVRELAAEGGGLANAVRIINEAVERVDDRYFRSFIDFGEVECGDMEATAPATGSVLCPNLEVDSWLRFNFHDIDFGSGSPCSFLPPNLPVEGLMLFVPLTKEKDGVDVFIALAAEHVGLFIENCYSLD